MAVDDYFKSLDPFHHFGLLPGAGAGGKSAAGASLPPSSTSAAAHDGGDRPWSPDSPIFWIAVIAGASFAGIVGASVHLHAGPARAGASIGKK